MNIHKRSSIKLLGLAAACIWFGLSSPQAQSSQETALTVVVTSGEGSTTTEYDLDDLFEAETIEVVTENDFVDGLKTFTGPLAKHFLPDLDQIDATTVRLTALNAYQIEFPVSDFFEYDVIFATHMNGTPLSRRDKGPLWVIYPMSDNPELRDNKFNSRLIWQLAKVEVF